MMFAACDLGGTNTRVALVDETGRILSQTSQSTVLSSTDALIDSLVRMITAAADAPGPGIDRLDGVGIAVAGTVDFTSGTVIASPNLPLNRTHLKHRLTEAIGRPVLVDNDATAAAVGEARFGAGRGASQVVLIVIGTGIGGGLIVDGRPYRGASGGAGEVGHMVVDPDGPLCACGRRGCLEALAAGPAIASRARAAVRRDNSSLILQLAGGDAAAITAETVVSAAAAGDPTAAAVWRDAAEIIGIAAANIVNLLNPEMIILGGGVTSGDTVILETTRRVVRDTALAPNRDDVKIVAAALGDNAGLIGAAALHF